MKSNKEFTYKQFTLNTDKRLEKVLNIHLCKALIGLSSFVPYS